MSDEIFGPLITGRDVELAAFETLQRWVPTYWAWLERQSGRPVGSLPQPRSWVSSGDVDRWPEEQLPCVMLLSPGLAGPPEREGAGFFRGHFTLGIAVVVSARGRQETDDLAKLYTAGLRAIMVHHPSLNGFASGLDWVDEEYDVLPARNRRQLAAGRIAFRVEVRELVAANGGPDRPLPDPQTPPDDIPLIQSSDIEVEARRDLSWDYDSLSDRYINRDYEALPYDFPAYSDLEQDT